MKILELLVVLLSTCIVAIDPRRFVRSQSSPNACYTPLRDMGVCVSLKYCPQVVNLFTQLPQNKAKQYSTALQRICGFETTYDNYPMVCCTRVVMDNHIDKGGAQVPETTTSTLDGVIALLTSTTERRAESTTTPTSIAAVGERSDICRGPANEQGFCNPLQNCTELLNRLQSDPTNETLKTYLRSSNKICGSIGTHVCCPSLSRIGTVLVNAANTDELPRRLPTEDEGCGFVQNNLPKIVGGENSSIGAWPWMVLLGYNVRSVTPFKCGGTLITARHVVTAAHCILRDLTFVRLGEFDLSTEAETKHVDINVKKMMGHPNFGTSADRRHDVAVLYLESNVEFTDLISPICMPISSDLRTKSFVGRSPYVAGWGRTMERGTPSVVLQQLQIPVLENSICRDTFQKKGQVYSERQFDESVLCAGVLVGGSDTCQGDSGGPLMLPELYKGITRYYLIGIISYGIGCARGNIPGVYTSTQYFMDWIVEMIADTS